VRIHAERETMPTIRVLIADDHRIVRQGLRHVCELTGDLAVVGEAEDGQEAVKMARQLEPDVILMDINMPLLDGVQATQRILETDLPTRVIILTMFRQDRYVFEAIKAGARGYLLKNVDEDDLVAAIRAVHRGDALINPGMAVKLLDEFRRLSQMDSDAEDMEGLTPGEMEVLRLVAQGIDNKAVAEQLALSERTVANRLSSIYEKLQVNNRTQAALVALRRGWATLEQED
jgi:DNA-binding NarL/FixJ family response regulator